MSDEKMRAEFEAWAIRELMLCEYALRRNSSGEYVDLRASFAWAAWWLPHHPLDAIAISSEGDPMRSPVPTTTDDQLDEIIQAEDIIRSLAIDLPQIKCDPVAKNTVQLLLNHIDTLLNHIDTLRNHDSYAVQLDARRRREIADLKSLVRDLLSVVETGRMNHLALAKARKIGREL